jgi:hypothetical protein
VIDSPWHSSGINLKGKSWPWTDFNFSPVNFCAPSSVEWKKGVDVGSANSYFCFEVVFFFSCYKCQMWGVNFVRQWGRGF